MFRLILILALAGLGFAYQSLGTPALDGTVWELKVRRDAFLALSHKDTLAFDRGRITSSRYLGQGYMPGGYCAKGGKTAPGFEAAMSRPGGGHLDWRGEVHGDRVEGTVVWTSPEGASKVYTFHGRRKTS